jgi:hydrogenase expression/formation protein HypE
MKDEPILLAHGAGGKLSRRLIEEIIEPAFSNPLLSPLNDHAAFTLPAGRFALTTDSFVINPIFFRGGDVGKLAVCGTVNDLAVGGAQPLYMSASFIIEEGLSIGKLKRIVRSMAEASSTVGVKIVTGDTKVVENGKGDGIFINTTGIGAVMEGVSIDPSLIRPTDKIIVSGPVGDHAVTVLKERGMIDLDISIESDCAPLWALVKEVLSRTTGVKAMRDPTRGGLATALSELASSSGFSMLIKEEAVPVKAEVKGVCEILGFDPLYLANEGKLVCIVKADKAEEIAAIMRENPLGKDASIIGEVLDSRIGKLILETPGGNRRFLEMLSGEQLPRIC